MPETNGNENPVSEAARKQNERTEARFFEDVDKLIAEAESTGGEYQPPNPISTDDVLKAKRDASMAKRGGKQSDDTAEEQERNARENLYKPMDTDVTSLVGYAKSAGKKPNEIAALQSIAREIKGTRAKPIDPNDTAPHISVANLSYVTRADNYARFVEQYDALAIPTEEDFYKASTHRAKLAAYRAANQAVITAEAKANASQAEYDQITYLDEDSLMNACISSKAYFKSKFKNTHYQNIAKTRFEPPTRLRKKK